MAKMERPIARFKERVKRAVALNDGATLTLKVRVTKTKTGKGELTEIRAVSDENELA